MLVCNGPDTLLRSRVSRVMWGLALWLVYKGCVWFDYAGVCFLLNDDCCTFVLSVFQRPQCFT